MITDSFDISTAPLMSPEDFYGKQKSLCDVCIITFSSVIFETVLATFKCEHAASINAANGKRDIYLIDLDGTKIAIYLSGIGSSIAANDVIEANWLTGATKFIMFGSAGSLNKDLTEGKYVIPTEAYRDEGMSYHYAAPSDYIKINRSADVAEMFKELGLPFVEGRVWTTDAFYRETRSQVQKRKNDGCIAVEMELAGVQAVCDFHKFELYDFLVTGDVLDAPTYVSDGLKSANHDLDKLYIALKIAQRIK